MAQDTGRAEQGQFQALIGTVETTPIGILVGYLQAFQALIGTVETI